MSYGQLQSELGRLIHGENDYRVNSQGHREAGAWLEEHVPERAVIKPG